MKRGSLLGRVTRSSLNAARGCVALIARLVGELGRDRVQRGVELAASFRRECSGSTRSSAFDVVDEPPLKDARRAGKHRRRRRVVVAAIRDVVAEKTRSASARAPCVVTIRCARPLRMDFAKSYEAPVADGA